MKWLKKWGYLWLLLLVGVFYFTIVDGWKVYAKALSPVAEWYDEQSEKSEVLATVNDWLGNVLEYGTAIAGKLDVIELPGWLTDWIQPEDTEDEEGLPEDGETPGATNQGGGVGGEEIPGESNAGENNTEDNISGDGRAENNTSGVEGSGGDNVGTDEAGTGDVGENSAGVDIPDENATGNTLPGTGQVNPGQTGQGNTHISIGGPENGVEVGFGDTEASEPDWHNVKDLYFADAVFIGDSRTVGLFEYGELEEITTFYAGRGLSVYDVFDKKIVEVEGQKKKITIDEALRQKSFSKIYLMLGLNEMGIGTTETFLAKYEEVLNHLQELQPDAIIYVQAIMKLTTERSGKGDQFHNPGIEERNAGLEQFSDNETVFFLDVNPLICDETGGMIEEYTTDGIHLKAKYIGIWKDYLKSHAIIP